jgi:hypothetical protein
MGVVFGVGEGFRVFGGLQGNQLPARGGVGGLAFEPVPMANHPLNNVIKANATRAQIRSYFIGMTEMSRLIRRVNLEIICRVRSGTPIQLK